MGLGLPLTIPSRDTLTSDCYNLRIISAISGQSFWDASITASRAELLYSPGITTTSPSPVCTIYRNTDLFLGSGIPFSDLNTALVFSACKNLSFASHKLDTGRKKAAHPTYSTPKQLEWRLK